MKKYASALAIAGLLAAPAAHSAAAVDFNGEFEVNAFTHKPDGATRVGALQQLLRLGANIKLDDGVQVVTRMNLSNNYWMGNGGAGTPGPAANTPSSDVSLDLGYLQLPLGPGVLRVGRQESNWANCFVSCDDRRDRIIYMSKIGTANVGVFYDKVVETGLPKGDASAYAAMAIAPLGPVVGGLLIYHVDFEKNFLDMNQTMISPYFQGKIAGFSIDGALRYDVFSGSGSPDDDAKAAYLRGGYDLGVAKIDGQIVWTKDGGAPNRGFDSFSSMINNDPINNSSPTSIANIGADTIGFAARVSGNVTNELKLIGGLGHYKDGDDVDYGTDTKMTFLDLQAHYQVTQSTLVWATAGRVKFKHSGSGAKADDDAFSLNIRTTF